MLDCDHQFTANPVCKEAGNGVSRSSRTRKVKRLPASPYFKIPGGRPGPVNREHGQAKPAVCVRARRWDLGSAILLLGFLEAWWSCML